MPPALPRMHITHMQLDKWNPHAQQRIPDRDRRMREGARVDDDAVDLVAGRGVDAVDEGAFVVGLEGLEGGVEGGGVGGAGRLDVGEGGGAVDVWFAGAEEVEVGAVEEEDGFAHFLSFLLFVLVFWFLSRMVLLGYAMRCDAMVTVVVLDIAMEKKVNWSIRTQLWKYISTIILTF